MKRKIDRRYVRKSIGKAAIVLAVLAAIVAAAYLILKLCGLTDMERLRSDLGDTFRLYAAIALLQAFQVVFIPLSNQIITVPACLVFSDHLLRVFLASRAGIEIGTIALYLLGRYGGKRVIGRILSDREKAERCAQRMGKGKRIYPVGMLIPFLPDDILTTMAGTAKYGFRYVLGVSTVARGICCACSVRGFGYLTRFRRGRIVLAGAGACLAAMTAILFRLSRKESKDETDKPNE